MFYTYNDFKKYEQYRKGEPAFPWLPKFETWLSKYYNVTFLPSIYEEKSQNNPNRTYFIITPVLMNKYDAEKVYTKTFKSTSFENVDYELKFMCQKAMEYIKTYNAPKIKDNDLLRVMPCNIFLDSYLYLYLFSYKSFELKKEILSFFSYLSPVYCSVEYPIACVLKTQKEARDFLLSEDYKKIKKGIFKLLQTFDDYDILNESDIIIFVDYKANKEKYAMYRRWITDMSSDEWKLYEKTIIDL